MGAGIANKDSDTVYKIGLTQYEPWQLVFGGAAAGAAMLGAGTVITRPAAPGQPK